MSLCCDDKTKHDINSSMERSCNDTTSSQRVTIHNARTPVSRNGPSLEIITSFTCCETSVGKVRVLGFGLRHTEVFARDCRHVSCEACCLVRIGVSKSDNCHKADSLLKTKSKFSRNLDESTVLMMGINKCVNEAHHHDPILEASQEHLNDEEKMDCRGSTESCPLNDLNM